MNKNKLARIEFLIDMYGNAAGERVWIEEMDDSLLILGRLRPLSRKSIY